MTSLSESCLLSKLTIHTFTRDKTDRQVAKEIDQSKGNKSGGKYTKTLFKGFPEIDAVYSKVQEIYNYHRHNSLPWLDGGTRIVPSESYDSYIEGLNKRKQELEQCFVKLQPNFDSYVQADLVNLGGVAKSNEYPSFDWFKNSFGIDIVLMPVPDARDFRIDVTEDMRLSLDKMLEEAKIKGKQDLYKRIEDVCTRIVEACNKPKGKIYESLLGNVLELSDVIDILNVHKDSELVDLNKELYALGKSTSTFNLRNSMMARQQLAADAGKLISKLRGATHDTQDEATAEAEESHPSAANDVL